MLVRLAVVTVVMRIAAALNCRRTAHSRMGLRGQDAIDVAGLDIRRREGV